MNRKIQNEVSKLLEIITLKDMRSNDVITWGSPVISFGDPTTSIIATLGLNPSNREFVDKAGQELTGKKRRFHTLSSLKLKKWSDINDTHLSLITKTYSGYFENNPYTNWFNCLDDLISSAGATFYGADANACHLDLVPYATKVKWGKLGTEKQTTLLKASSGSLGVILKNSNIDCIILNGMSVLRAFEFISDVKLSTKEVHAWSLPRSNGKSVKGISFSGHISRILNCKLGREIQVLGYNHNLQSSFGVTKSVKSSIKAWVGRNQEVIILEE
ncbi:MAG: hypothetical protein ABW176_02405 [Candidatus Thiodiazotropha endolucinida]